jgi:hypothetical protein
MAIGDGDGDIHEICIKNLLTSLLIYPTNYFFLLRVVVVFGTVKNLLCMKNNLINHCLNIQTIFFSLRVVVVFRTV